MGSTAFRRGVRLHASLIRDARLLQGLRQKELARRAGVGERTVRKAEFGEIIERHIADYICTALNLSLEEAIAAEAIQVGMPSLKQAVLRFERSFEKAIIDGEPNDFLSWLHPNVEWLCVSSHDPTLYEQAHGVGGSSQLLIRLCNWISRKNIQERSHTIRYLRRSGDALYAYSEIRLSPKDGRSIGSRIYWSTKLMRFEDDKIRHLLHFWGPIPRRVN